MNLELSPVVGDLDQASLSVKGKYRSKGTRYAKSIISQAVKELEAGISMWRVSSKYGVPKRTLYKKLKKADDKEIVFNKKLKCQFCQKDTFIHRSGLKIHEKYCIHRNEIQEIQEVQVDQEVLQCDMNLELSPVVGDLDLDDTHCKMDIIRIFLVKVQQSQK